MSHKINFVTLLENNPVLLDIKSNSFGQRVEFYEHPFEGEDHPVIVAFPKYGKAFNSDFYETTDMMQIEDYEPHFVAGELKFKYELD